VGSDSSVDKGPIPDGLYAIGTVFKNNGKPWANMYPQKQSGGGWWDYYRDNPDTGRGYIGLHPGSDSHGCVTVTAESCWDKLEKMLKLSEQEW
jgi:hypothetical protein